MDLTTKRTFFNTQGILGEMHNTLTTGPYFYADTLEHAYIDGLRVVAKIPPGIYKCVRHAPNHLPYETFMIEDVPDFQGKPVNGILIHKADFPNQLEGCIAVGMSSQRSLPLRIFESEKAFDRLMAAQSGCDMFMLTIES